MDNPSGATLTPEQVAENIMNRPPISTRVDVLADEAPTGNPVVEEEHEQVEETADSPEEQQEAEATPEEEELKLPSEQERDYSDDVYARYAKRMNRTLEDVESDPALKRFIKSKIDTDIFAEQQKQERAKLVAELEQLKAKANAFVADEEGTEADGTTPTTPEEQRTQYLQRLDKFADEVTDPEMAKQFALEYYKVWGIAEPSEEDMKRIGPLVKAYTKGVVNIMNTVAPRLLQSWMESTYPGVNENWERGTYQRAWEAVRAADERFKALPNYATDEFRSLMHKVAEIQPEFENMVFTDKRGRPLSKFENAKAQYRLAALIAAGQNPQVKPEVVKAAIEKGKAQAQAAERKKELGKITGAGQSKGTFAEQKKGKGSGLGLVEAYENANPSYISDDKRKR